MAGRVSRVACLFRFLPHYFHPAPQSPPRAPGGAAHSEISAARLGPSPPKPSGEDGQHLGRKGRLFRKEHRIPPKPGGPYLLLLTWSPSTRRRVTNC